MWWKTCETTAGASTAVCPGMVCSRQERRRPKRPAPRPLMSTLLPCLSSLPARRRRRTQQRAGRPARCEVRFSRALAQASEPPSRPAPPTSYVTRHRRAVRKRLSSPSRGDASERRACLEANTKRRPLTTCWHQRKPRSTQRPRPSPTPAQQRAETPLTRGSGSEPQ